MSQSTNESKRILIVGPTWVGDTIMAQSLLISLKQKQSCSIDFITSPGIKDLVSRMPEVNEVIPFSKSTGKFLLSKRYNFAKSLQEKKYHQAIVLPNSFKSALIPFLAKIPKRTGWLGEFRYGVLNDARKLIADSFPRMVERYVALAYKQDHDLSYEIPYPNLTISDQGVAKVQDSFKIKLDNKPIIALCPGAAYGPAKRWPVDYFAKLAKHYLSQNGQVWLFGAKDDEEISTAINKETEFKCTDFTGVTSLSEKVDILSLSDVVISNDSGLMHLASAIQKPVIAIYGPTDFKYCPPLTKKAKCLTTHLPCQPCKKRVCPLKHHLCMKKIVPEEVIKSIEELL